MAKLLEDYVTQISETEGMPKKQVRQVLRTFKEAMIEDIEKGQIFEIKGLIKSKRIKREGYKGSGVLTGTMIPPMIKTVINISADLQKRTRELVQ